MSLANNPKGEPSK